MTTTSEPATSPQRFAAAIIELHDRLRYQGFQDAVAGAPLARIEDRGDGLTTVAVAESQLPERYLRAVMGFRLAKFLQVGLMDPGLAYRQALFHEPVRRGDGPETIHAVTLTGTGRLAGYGALVGSADPVPLPLDSPRRRRFPAEVAHRVDLVSRYAAPGVTTAQVYEVKRLVREPGMAPGPQRDRVPWHTILALGRTVLDLGMRHVLGDSRQDGALRHFRLIGFDPMVVDRTAPMLPRTELMWPSYELPVLAKPFIGAVPPDFARFLDVIDRALSEDHRPDWIRGTLASLQATRRRRRR